MPDFGVNLSELVVLAVVAVLIFGPEKLPELARKVGRVTRYLRGIANDAREHVRDEFGDDVADFDPRGLHPKNLARSVLGGETVGELRTVADDARSSLAANARRHIGTPPKEGSADTIPGGGYDGDPSDGRGDDASGGGAPVSGGGAAVPGGGADASSGGADARVGHCGGDAPSDGCDEDSLIDYDAPAVDFDPGHDRFPEISPTDVAVDSDAT
jgi:sec-independent protein translocase protein TatB